VDSDGVKSPIKSENDLLNEKGISPFIMKDVNDYNKFTEFIFVKPPQMPSFIKKYLAKQALKAQPFNKKMWKDMEPYRYILESKLNKITAPTLIIWGDSDRIIHISSIPIFEKNIKNSKSVIIKECGHVPQMEKPAETAAAYQDFLKGTNK
jgi:pimeloyl-ACP methyl ester carboxylesterase